MARVAVVGAGVIGLSAAVCIQKLEPTAQVTIISEEFSPHTTGDGAAGLWTPFLVGSTPLDKVKKWSKATHDFLLELWNTENGGKLGIMLLPVTRVTSDDSLNDEAWKDTVFGYRVLTKKELAATEIPDLTYGTKFVTFICEPAKLLPYLLQRFKEKGGKVIKQRVSDLKTLQHEFDIVVNCTGVQAHHVVGDKKVKPIRGQVLKVEAPEISHAFLSDCEDGHYVIPNQDSVTLGGTHQENDWNRNPYPEDTKFIKEGCEKLYPTLKQAKLVREWVGLRPGRESVRLELEIINIPGGAPLKVKFIIVSQTLLRNNTPTFDLVIAKGVKYLF
ncbi:unnamed protein product [Allacma fusca]|uniref:FAD dependent oxidoreductase domain-containing protein n=1 Tax=Allacma fusca TaxID=39272 RepID=A0A8J2PTY9_9HEXA|nr:unnamed protein product [Allacma fusca]